MSNNKFKKISSVCTTPKELITSDDFIKWLEIILRQVKGFDKDYILWLFTKLKREKVLDAKEKENLLKFLNNNKVIKFGEELLSKLKNVSLSIKINNTNEGLVFLQLINDIFSENRYTKITNYVKEKVESLELAFNPYEWMTKIQIDLNWENREIWLDDENFKVDSSDWEIGEIEWVKVKINPQWDITEFLEWKFKWEQLFTHQAALREAKKMWKRLACADDDNNEFQAIIEKVWIQEFSKVSLGFRYLNLSGFCEVSWIAYWSSSVINWKYAVAVESINSDPKLYINELNKSFGLSVRLVKD